MNSLQVQRDLSFQVVHVAPRVLFIDDITEEVTHYVASVIDQAILDSGNAKDEDWDDIKISKAELRMFIEINGLNTMRFDYPDHSGDHGQHYQEVSTEQYLSDWNNLNYAVKQFLNRRAN